MLIKPEDVKNIKDNKITLVKKFLTLEKNYDFNFISNLLEKDNLEVMQKSQYSPLKNIYQIRYANNSVQEFMVFFDFLRKLFKYKLDDKDGIDLFMSFVTQTGTPHIDPEDVYIIGLEGEVIYRTYGDDNKDYKICKGDLIYIPKGLKHRVIGLTHRIIASVGFFERGDK